MKSIKKLILQQSTTLDKSAWNRKFDNLQELVDKVNELSSQILDIEEQKMPIIDEITKLRSTMVNECYHPEQYLFEHDDYVECKFCGKVIYSLD